MPMPLRKQVFGKESTRVDNAYKPSDKQVYEKAIRQTFLEAANERVSLMRSVPKKQIFRSIVQPQIRWVTCEEFSYKNSGETINKTARNNIVPKILKTNDKVYCYI